MEKDNLKELFEEAYTKMYWPAVENIIDEEGWVYVKEAHDLLDVSFENNTQKDIEYQKSFGRSGDNPNWLTRGARWRPKEISDYFINKK